MVLFSHIDFSTISNAFIWVKNEDKKNCSFLRNFLGDSQGVLVVKNLPDNAGDAGLIPGYGRSPGGGHGNPLWYSCLENPKERGAWWAAVHRVAELDMTEAS